MNIADCSLQFTVYKVYQHTWCRAPTLTMAPKRLIPKPKTLKPKPGPKPKAKAKALVATPKRAAAADPQSVEPSPAESSSCTPPVRATPKGKSKAKAGNKRKKALTDDDMMIPELPPAQKTKYANQWQSLGFVKKSSSSAPSTADTSRGGGGGGSGHEPIPAATAEQTEETCNVHLTLSYLFVFVD